MLDICGGDGHMGAKIMGARDSRKIIKMYNKVARTLVAFEFMWYVALWSNAKCGRGVLSCPVGMRLGAPASRRPGRAYK